MKFVPADNYKDLKVQASALARLVDCLEKRLEATVSQTDLLYENALLREQLESEQDMNDRLTRELSAIRGDGENNETN